VATPAHKYDWGERDPIQNKKRGAKNPFATRTVHNWFHTSEESRAASAAALEDVCDDKERRLKPHAAYI